MNLEQANQLAASHLQASNDQAKAKAAIESLERLGYTYEGGQLWKPPLANIPAWIQNAKERSITTLEVYQNVIDPAVGKIAELCEKAGMSFLFSIHTPTDDNPLLCQAIAGLFDEAPETMVKLLEIIKSRPVVDEPQPLPDSLRDNC